MKFEVMVHFKQVSVQSCDEGMLTKSKQPVPNGLGSESALS